VQATDYEQVAKQEHLSSIEVQVRRLNDRIRDIRSEQNYQRVNLQLLLSSKHFRRTEKCHSEIPASLPTPE
jgi:hypothetical protein